jgi:hypothetical protein
MSSTDQYFAVKPSLELAKEIMSRVAMFQNIVGTNSEGMASVWNRNLNYYYSSIFYGTGGSSGLEFAGTQGELVKMLVPQARALNQQFLSLTTKTKLNFEPQAESGDSRTVSDTRISKALCDQTARKEKLDLSGYRMAEQTSVLGAGFLKSGWNLMRGKKVAVHPQNGAIVRTGDSDIETLSVYDVMFDLAVEDFYKLNDCIVRVVRNRWDLIAQNPHLEQRIKTIPSINKGTDFNFFWQESYSQDLIYVYEWYHKSSPALPDGRMMALCDDITILFDDDNPYKNDQMDAYIPVSQMKPEGIAGTGYGYPFFSNILPMQEMMDMCFSAAATNNAATAVQTILNPIGNGINVVDIGGMKFVNYKPMQDSSGGKPESLQLTKTAPETYKFMDMLRSYMMEIYNISGAMRGNPPPGVTSGTAIATLTTNSLEFAQNFSKSYVDAVETCMTHNMWNYKTFATQPMILSIAGPNNTAIAKEFTNKDISPIRRVVCRMANPLMATSAGKFEIANQLLQQGMIKDPETYWRILEGAPIETLYDPQYSQQELIQRENDMMRQGGNPQVLITDNHAKHIAAHLGLVDDPDIRMNGDMTGIVLEHVLEHVNKAREQAADPVLASIIQTGKLPPPEMMMPPPGQDMGPPPGQGMGPPPEAADKVMGPPPGADKKPANPAKPSRTLVPQVEQPNEAIPNQSGV